MSKKLYDFECEDGHVFEELVDLEYRRGCCATDAWCSCGKPAKVLMPAPRIDRSRIALSASASPESIAHFDRVHRQRKAIEEKRFADHGDYGKSAGSD